MPQPRWGGRPTATDTGIRAEGGDAGAIPPGSANLSLFGAEARALGC